MAKRALEDADEPAPTRPAPGEQRSAASPLRSPKRDDDVFVQNRVVVERDGWPDGPPKLQYEVLAHETVHEIALKLERSAPNRFRYHPSKWNKFDEGGTDNIQLGGFHPTNLLRGRHVLFIASFHNNDVTLSQFHAFVALMQSFVRSFTVCLPFYPVGTMERVVTEGTVATANTLAQLFAGLPHIGSPTRLMIYDLHTLQNRFYFSSSTVASLVTAVPLLLQRLREPGCVIDTIAFPDDGACKRFAPLFPTGRFHVVVCAKKRDGDQRHVVITEGEAKGRHCCIVDDLTRSGGTLYEAGLVLRKSGAASVSCFVTHGVFPFQTWKDFVRGGPKAGLFERIWTTNSVPTTTDHLPTDDVFEVLDLVPQIIHDL